MTLTPTLPLETVSPVSTAHDGPKSAARFRDRVRQRAGEQDLLVVRIGCERFGLPLDAVDELVESPRLRAIPGAPGSLLGVFTFGTAMLPLYSPSALLGADAEGAPVALVMRGGRTRIAIAVDDADDVVRVNLEDVRDPPRSDRHDDVVLGVLWRDGNLVAVVDARALVAACGSLFPEPA